MEREYYSQHGEDIIIDRVIRTPGFFVEVGVIDGKRFSNTFALEQRGWRGVCIEAHPDFIEMIRMHRPRSSVIHAAVSDQSGGSLPFYADPRGDLSSLINRDSEQMRERFGEWYQGVRRVDVPARTLDDILVEVGAPMPIDAVSIDIEGAELAALRGFDLAKWRPRILILEADDTKARDVLDEHLNPRGYCVARQAGVNLVYTPSFLDTIRVKLVRVDQRVLQTANPVDRDSEDQLFIPSTYETKRQYVSRMLGFRRAA